jgi:pyruvate/2-oxoglutarate dehydrogenase complex dihydrolipoamide dehydrogenase (E3) component
MGAGFIGLEMVENSVKRGITTTVVEKNDQIRPPFDKEMTMPMLKTLVANGVTMLLGQSAECFEQTPEGISVRLKSGERLPAQLVILGVGVRPENKLAVDKQKVQADRNGFVFDGFRVSKVSNAIPAVSEPPEGR